MLLAACCVRGQQRIGSNTVLSLEPIAALITVQHRLPETGSMPASSLAANDWRPVQRLSTDSGPDDYRGFGSRAFLL